jgi:hypothetical protein
VATNQVLPLFNGSLFLSQKRKKRSIALAPHALMLHALT